MISMREIADVCQVSQATVSKALSNREGVGSKTRARILRVAKQFNYLPNALVRSIQSGQSKTVAVACNAIDDPWGSLIMRGILEKLGEEHFEALLFNWDSGVRENAHMLRSMRERRVDGLLMFPPAQIPSAEYMEELRAFNRPIALIDQRWPHLEFDFVGTDDAAGARALAEHLLDLGHTRIANLHYAGVSSGRARLDAFNAVLAERGVSTPRHWLANCQTSYEAAYRQTAKWLSGSPRPTAIVCFNDLIALAALAAAADLGVPVPGELSITGFCDLPVAAQVRPALTTVRQDPLGVGRRAASLMMMRIAQHFTHDLECAPEPDPTIRELRDWAGEETETGTNAASPQTILLPTALVLRQSVGSAPDAAPQRVTKPAAATSTKNNAPKPKK